MTKKINKSKQGGKRAGAGRKVEGPEKRVDLSARVLPATKKAIQERRGGKSVGKFLDEIVLLEFKKEVENFLVGLVKKDQIFKFENPVDKKRLETEAKKFWVEQLNKNKPSYVEKYELENGNVIKTTLYPASPCSITIKGPIFKGTND